MKHQTKAAHDTEPEFCILCDKFPPKYIVDMKSAALFLKQWSLKDREGQKHFSKMKGLPAGEDGLVEYILTIFPSQRFNRTLKESCEHSALYECIEAETGLDKRAANFFSGRLLKEISKARHYLEVMFETTRQLSVYIPKLRAAQTKEKQPKTEALKEEKTAQRPSPELENPQEEALQYYLPMYGYTGAYNPLFCLYQNPQ